MLTNSKGQALGQEVDILQNHEEQRAEAVSRLKLLPMPDQLQEQVRNKDALVSQDALVSGMLSGKVSGYCTCEPNLFYKCHLNTSLKLVR